MPRTTSPASDGSSRPARRAQSSAGSTSSTFARAQAASGGLVSGTGADGSAIAEPARRRFSRSRRREVVAGREHPVLVHDVGKLSVCAREPEGEFELFARELGIAVPQPDGDEVGVPLPEPDVSDLRRHDRPRATERRQLDDVGAEHPPAERGHRLQIAAHARTTREPVEPDRLARRQIVDVVVGCPVPNRAVGADVEAHASGPVVELHPRCRAIGRRPLDRDRAGRPGTDGECGRAGETERRRPRRRTRSRAAAPG